MATTPSSRSRLIASYPCANGETVEVSTAVHYTYSLDVGEARERHAVYYLRSGGNVAVVFRDGLPTTWNGFPVIDGDETDVRYLDKPGTVIGLKAKGKARGDTSGFVRPSVDT